MGAACTERDKTWEEKEVHRVKTMIAHRKAMKESRAKKLAEEKKLRHEQLRQGAADRAEKKRRDDELNAKREENLRRKEEERQRRTSEEVQRIRTGDVAVRKKCVDEFTD